LWHLTKKQLQHLHDDEKLHNHLANEIIWHFVPSAPNFGEVCETTVKSMKIQLRNATLTFKGRSTVLSQFKASLNSISICVTCHIEDIDVLTPDHFLPVDQLVAISEPIIEDFFL
jgi:hypothetical protein